MKHPQHDHSEPGANPDHVDNDEGPTGQGLQINENTIDDPGQKKPKEAEHLHGRSDFAMNRDQGMQINDNSIGDKKDS